MVVPKHLSLVIYQREVDGIINHLTNRLALLEKKCHSTIGCSVVFQSPSMNAVVATAKEDNL